MTYISAPKGQYLGYEFKQEIISSNQKMQFLKLQKC